MAAAKAEAQQQQQQQRGDGGGGSSARVEGMLQELLAAQQALREGGNTSRWVASTGSP